MTYAVAAHPSLSAAAVALRDAGGGSASDPSAAFTATGDAAEIALGLNGTAFTGADADTARLAVVYQINAQADGGDGRPVKRETRGERTVEYFAADTVHPTAQMLADRLLATLVAAPVATDDEWAVVGNTR